MHGNDIREGTVEALKSEVYRPEKASNYHQAKHIHINSESDDEGIEDELNFIVHQLNESLRDTRTLTMMDATCDVASSMSMVIDTRETKTTGLMLDSLLRLGESELISNDESSLLSFRNFTASYNVYPSTLILTHRNNRRSYDIFVEDPVASKYRIEVNTDKFRLAQDYELK